MPEKPTRLFYVDDPRFEDHKAEGSAHPECPERLSALREGLIVPLRDAGAERLKARPASKAELQRAHDVGYIESLKYRLGQGAGYLDGDTFYSQGTAQATFLAAGGAAELGMRLAKSDNAAGVLAVRPPGHHATASRAMGFCLVNNVAVAAHAALQSGIERVAIVDWDVHHGNGTQAIFHEDPRVLFISIHQWPLYPGSGKSEEIGKGAGLGHTVNLPLPAGSSGKDYYACLQQVALPVLRQFRPELVLISAGFDAHADDPLGGMVLQDHDFGALTSSIWRESSGFGCKKLGIVLEGGYDLGALERAGNSVAEALLGTERELDASAPTQRAQEAVDRTRYALAKHWML